MIACPNSWAERGGSSLIAGILRSVPYAEKVSGPRVARNSTRPLAGSARVRAAGEQARQVGAARIALLAKLPAVPMRAIVHLRAHRCAHRCTRPVLSEQLCSTEPLAPIAPPAADMQLAAAEGAVDAYGAIIGETWKPYVAPADNAQPLDQQAAAAELEAFGG
jgi:hypothetical protein